MTIKERVGLLDGTFRIESSTGHRHENIHNNPSSHD